LIDTDRRGRPVPPASLTQEAKGRDSRAPDVAPEFDRRGYRLATMAAGVRCGMFAGWKLGLSRRTKLRAIEPLLHPAPSRPPTCWPYVRVAGITDYERSVRGLPCGLCVGWKETGGRL